MSNVECRYGKMQLMALLLAVPVVVWFFGWSKTLSLWQDCRQNEQRLQELRLCSDTVAAHSGESFVRFSALKDGALLGWIRENDKDREVQFLNYSPWLTWEQNGLQLYTAEMTLSGGFIPLLQLMAALEEQGKCGSIASVLFQSHIDRKTHEKQLRLTLWIQQISEARDTAIHD